jgi:hypothetical protein
MYTEFVFKAIVSENAPENVKAILRGLFNGDAMIGILSAHKFFDCKRWADVGRSHSYYHIPWSDSKYKENRIFSRSDLKNYDNEIEKFVDWVSPYLEAASDGNGMRKTQSLRCFTIRR